MRTMSFALTTQQIRERTKTVTRRMGWGRAKSGDLLVAVEKGRGVKIADRVKLGVIRVVSVRREYLDRITDEEVEAEGFPGKTAAEFVAMFTANMKCRPDQIVTRIEFEYVQEEEPCPDPKTSPNSTSSSPTPARSRRRGTAASPGKSG